MKSIKIRGFAEKTAQPPITFKDSWEVLMEDYDDNPDVTEEEILAKRQKYTPTNVNPDWIHEQMRPIAQMRTVMLKLDIYYLLIFP